MHNTKEEIAIGSSNRMRGIIGGLVYFLALGAIYSSYYYSAQYLYHEWGVSLSGHGLLALIACVAGFVGSALVTALADATRRHEAVLCVCTCAYALSFSMLAVPPEWLPTKTRFLYATVANTFTVVFSSAMFPLVNNTVSRIVSATASSSGGRHMMWGSVGVGVSTGVVSACISMGLGRRSVFVATLAWSLALCLTIFFCCSLCCPSSVVKNKKTTDRAKVPWWSLLTDVTFVFFLLSALAAGVMRALVAIYLPFYMLAADMEEASIGAVYVTRTVYESWSCCIASGCTARWCRRTR
jgi:MFS family permease